MKGLRKNIQYKRPGKLLRITYSLLFTVFHKRKHQKTMPQPKWTSQIIYLITWESNLLFSHRITYSNKTKGGLFSNLLHINISSLSLHVSKKKRKKKLSMINTQESYLTYNVAQAAIGPSNLNKHRILHYKTLCLNLFLPCKFQL